MHKKLSPDILFLSETKNSNEFVLRKCKSLRYENSLLIPPQGHGSGGLALFWKKGIELNVKDSCKNIINAEMKYENKTFLASFVYGNPEPVLRRQLWQKIANEATTRDMAWILTGDLNDIVNEHEKVGGRTRAEGSYTDFRTFLSECDLYDLPHTGDFLSWRGVRNEEVVRCRLDRTLANSQWFDTFHSGVCEYLKYEGSDHKPILTCFDFTRKKGKGIFRFDRRLKDNPEVKSLVEKTWKEAGTRPVHYKISQVRRAIILWNKEQQRNSRILIEQWKEALDKAMSSNRNEGETIAKLNADLTKAYLEEEAYWKQRSRNLWLSLGDKNSGYFHSITKGRKAINNFSVIENSEGEPIFTDNGISKVIMEYFDNLFKSSPGERPEIVNEALLPKITDASNQHLIAIPTSEEIHLALLAIHPGKAPGPDGFSASFFQANWVTVGADIVKEIQHFFTSGSLPRTINSTHVRLIPKSTTAKLVSDYRPIALCNVYYKIISKLLAHRLKQILPDLISENQSAFVHGRAITDNILISHEVLHFLKTSEASKHCSMAVKTDMSKAYDRLEWDFIEAVLLRLGFHAVWTNWIMQCIRTVTYSYLVNESVTGVVTPHRGIRQGDPLSPYIFILCSEVLSGLCRNAQENNTLQGIRVATNSPRVNHLLFADDTLFFCRTNTKSLSTLKKILQLYEEASGQKINAQKSGITFSNLTPQALKEKIKEELGIEKEGGAGKYLGIPEHFGRKKSDMFTFVVDKIKQRAAGWSTRYLSLAGKLTLLKSVLSAIPNHPMQCFKLPQSLCRRIQSAFTRFWWDASPETRKMSWIAWDTMVKSKKDGGLGIRDIQSFNDALLAKTSWRILSSPSCLLARILRGKYLQDKDFLHAAAPESCSHGWRGILIGRDLIKEHLGWVVGDGQETKIWREPWLSSTAQRCPMGPAPEDRSEAKVAELFRENSREWDVEKIEGLFPMLAGEIMTIKPSKWGGKDKRIWLNHKSGEYSTKTGYYAALEKNKPGALEPLQPAQEWIDDVWKVPISPKLKLLIWKIKHRAIPVGEILMARHILPTANCIHCKGSESILHLFFHCPFAQKVWELLPVINGLAPLLINSFNEGWRLALKATTLPPTGLNDCPLIPWVISALWTTRNLKIFQQRHFTPQEVISKAIIDAKEWKLAQVVPIPPKRGVTPRKIDADSVALCRSDAAWSNEHNTAGLGWSFSVNQNERFLSHSDFLSFVRSPLVAEGLAVRMAMEHAIALQLKQVIFESDSAQLVAAIVEQSGISDLHGILADIYLLSLQFDSVSFRYVNRSSLCFEDNLAKQALRGPVRNPL